MAIYVPIVMYGLKLFMVVNPRRAITARDSSLFPCVCLSVTMLAKASLGSMPRKRYVQHWYRLFSVLSSRIFEKNLPCKSYGVKKPIANEYPLT